MLPSSSPIFLIGFMGTGKSTVGRLVAAELGYAFADLDEVIAREAGASVPQIFAAEGEAGFRQREAAAVRAAAAMSRTVIATGGGAACREANLAAMLAAGRVVALAATPAEVLRRTGGGAGRPLLEGKGDAEAVAAALLAERQPFYARAHASVDTGGKEPAEVAREVLQRLGLPIATAVDKIGVELGARRYDVHIGTFAADDVAATLAAALGGDVTGVAVLVDSGMAACSPRVAPLMEALARRLPRVARHDLPAGEACKNLAEVERTAEWLAQQGYDRRAAVIGLGGGATTDHAGFVAAIYLRGIRFALCPTTLLAMVDASVGGKTGVDLAAGKNLVGAFHQPRTVVADLGYLDTLPARERVAGLAEVIKCGFIADPTLLAAVEAWGAGGAPSASEAYRPLCAGAVRVKAGVVAEDEQEGGRRAILNFGHTIGHALEAASGYALLHGEAVSLGMIAALSLGGARGVTPEPLLGRARRLLEAVGLPVDLERRLDAPVLARVGVDKKRQGAQIRFVFCPAAGEARLEDVTADDLVSHFLSSSPGGAKATG